MDLGQYEDAIQEFCLIIESKQSDPFVFNNKSLCLIKLERYEEAIIDLNEAIQLDQNDPIFLYHKGLALAKMELHNKATLCNQIIYELIPKTQNSWYYKGYVLVQLKRYGESIICNEQVIQMNPNNAKAWKNKGVALNNLNNHNDAIFCYDKAIEINPNNSSYWNCKGRSLSFLDRNEEAIICIDKAIKLNPINSLAWNNKGLAFINLGNALSNLKRYDEALTSYDKAIQINLNNAQYWCNKGQTYTKLIDIQKISKNSHGFYNINHFRSLNITIFFNSFIVKLGKLFYSALESYDMAIQLNPFGQFYYREKGILLEGFMFYNQAITCYDQAISKNLHKFYINKIQLLQKMNQNYQAILCFTNFINVSANQDPFHLNTASQSLSNLKLNRQAIKIINYALQQQQELEPILIAFLYNVRSIAIHNLGWYIDGL